MKLKNLHLYIIMLFIFLSCDKHGIDFEINNNQNETIDSLTVSNGFNESDKITLKPNGKATVFLDFKANNTHSDGNFFIKYYSNKKQILKSFGYYSNGIPSTNKMKIEIAKDTLLVYEAFE